MTKKTRRVRPVHITRLLNGTLVSGSWISGTRGTNGFTRSRKRTILQLRSQSLCIENDCFQEWGYCGGSRRKGKRDLRPLMVAVEWLYISTKETKGVEDCRKGRMNGREE